MSALDKRMEYAAKQAVWYRNYRRARERALVRLAQAHADEYREYLQQERARDVENGTAWDTLSSGLGSGLDDQPISPTAGKISTDGGEARDNGGEK